MEMQGLIGDLETLIDRACNSQPEESIKISGLYCYCFDRDEFTQACKLLGSNVKPNYQATNLQLEEQLPGGLRIVINVDYRQIQDLNQPKITPTQPIKEPPAITKYVLDPEMVKLIEDKIGAELPKL
jgi:hypothetical protein